MKGERQYFCSSPENQGHQDIRVNDMLNGTVKNKQV
jgi:hypothetical protein